MSELPKGWATATVEEVGIPPGTTVDPARYKEEEFELYSVPSYSTGQPEIVIGAEIGSTKQHVEPGDVLVCKIVPHINRVWVVPAKNERRQIASSEWIIVRNKKLHAGFLRYCFSGPDFRAEFLKDLTGIGGSLTRARPQNVKLISIPVAPFLEQNRIVTKLDGLLARSKGARDELARVPVLIKHYEQAILEKAFSGELTKDWRAKSKSILSAVVPRAAVEMKPKYHLAEGADFSAPFEIPDGWQWLRLPELGNLDRGKSKHRPRNDSVLYDGIYPFVQTGEVREADRYLRSYSKTYNDMGLAQSRLWPKGTVCITIAANIAETAILDIEACFPDSVVGFVADEGRVSNSFIEFFLRTMKEQLEAFAPATA
ncbi:restriction endonuclease subunit S, partial [Roseomonas mucosa]